jgi:hypothetical protein
VPPRSPAMLLLLSRDGPAPCVSIVCVSAGYRLLSVVTDHMRLLDVRRDGASRAMAAQRTETDGGPGWLVLSCRAVLARRRGWQTLRWRSSRRPG